MILLDLESVPDIRQTGRDNFKQLEMYKMPDMRVDDLEFNHGIEVTDEGIYFPVGVRDYGQQDEEPVELHEAEILSPWEMPADRELFRAVLCRTTEDRADRIFSYSGDGRPGLYHHQDVQIQGALRVVAIFGGAGLDTDRLYTVSSYS